MRLSDAAIGNRAAVYLLMAMIIFIGWGAYTSLPREAAPDITIPLVIVSVPYIGVSPTDMEGLVTQPLERALKSLKDVKHITSASKEGLATIQVEFNTGIDIDEALRRVRDKVNSTRSQLPNEILEPVVNEINISEFPIMYVNVGGSVGLARLKKIADNLQDRIEAVPGVLRADINGGIEPEVQVNCDLFRMNAYEISFDDVANAVRQENLTIPGGSIDTRETNFNVRIPGEFKTVRPLEDIVVKIRNGKAIYLRDVASVDYSFEDRATYSRLNRTEVVSLGVRKRAGENLIRIADQVKSILEEERKALPAGITLQVSNDQSTNIKQLVKELENSIGTGMFLVVLTLFMFFGFKNSLLISTAIPFSMLIGFIVLSALHVTLNFVVLFTLVLVLGILVDDAIVVIENIYRHQQEYGKTPIQAAKDATSEVALPVFTSTVTTLSGFIPLLFWPGIVGDFMSYLPITLMVTLFASLFVAFVISPVQGSKWIDYNKEIRKAKENLEHPHWYKKYNPFTILFHKVDTVFFPFMQRVYVKQLGWTLQHKKLAIGGMVGFLLLVFVLFGLFNSGVVFFPNVEPSLVRVNIEAPPGTSLTVTNGIAELLEKRFDEVPDRPDIEYVVTTVGTSDNVFDFGAQGTPDKAQIGINFFQKHSRKRSTFVTLEEVRSKTLGIPGADIRVAKQEMGPPTGAPVSVEISGDDYAELARLSAEIRRIIKPIPNLVDLKDDYNVGKPEIEIRVDREKAGLLWTNTRAIAGTVRAMIAGVEASKYRVGEDEYKIRVRAEEAQRMNVQDLENLHVTFMNMQGKIYSVPIGSLASVVKTSSVSDVRRKDLKRVITITADAEGRLASEVLNDIKAKLAGFELPPGYQISFTGQDEEQKKAQAFLGNAFLITLMLVFFILVAEFKTLRVPFVIMLSVLLSLIGVMVGLVVTRTPFSVIMTGVGIIALAGIVVRNGIVLLDFAKHKLEQGMPLDEALLEAGRVRLRPVLLTAAATVLGVLPLATGFDFDWREFHFIIGADSAAFWGPLGVAIIFGLTIATFLTLVIVPTFYALLEEWTKGVGARMRKLFRMKPRVETPGA